MIYYLTYAGSHSRLVDKIEFIGGPSLIFLKCCNVGTDPFALLELTLSLSFRSLLLSSAFFDEWSRKMPGRI
jgi:hypothetical protein